MPVVFADHVHSSGARQRVWPAKLAQLFDLAGPRISRSSMQCCLDARALHRVRCIHGGDRPRNLGAFEAARAGWLAEGADDTMERTSK